MSSVSKELIRVQLNGKTQEIAKDSSVSDLLLKWKVRAELVTVEINENILQKLEYDSTVIRENDHIEFVFYMGGGSGVTLNLKKGL